MQQKRMAIGAQNHRNKAALDCDLINICRRGTRVLAERAMR